MEYFENEEILKNIINITLINNLNINKINKNFNITTDINDIFNFTLIKLIEENKITNLNLLKLKELLNIKNIKNNTIIIDNNTIINKLNNIINMNEFTLKNKLNYLNNINFELKLNIDLLNILKLYNLYLNTNNIKKENTFEIFFIFIFYYLYNEDLYKYYDIKTFKNLKTFLNKNKEEMFYIEDKNIFEETKTIINNFNKTFNEKISELKKLSFEQLQKENLKKVLEFKTNYIKINYKNKLYLREDIIKNLIIELYKEEFNSIYIPSKTGNGNKSILYSLPFYIDKYNFSGLEKLEIIEFNLMSLFDIKNVETLNKEYFDIIFKNIDKNINGIIYVNIKEDYNNEQISIFNLSENLSERKYVSILIHLSNYLKKFKNLNLIVFNYYENKNEHFKYININKNFTNFKINTLSKIEIKEILKLKKIELNKTYNLNLNNKNIDNLIDYILDNNNSNNLNELINDFHKNISKIILNNEEKKEISNKEIENILNKYSNNILKNTNLDIISNDIKKNLFGQDETIDIILNKFEIYKNNYNEKNKPLCSYLLSGNSGTGKTELGKILAKVLKVNLIRFDMSEYVTPHTIFKLLGSPNGYVDSDKKGLLIDKVLDNPRGVFIFDEIEKCDPSIIKMFLQILEEAEITSSTGIKVSFKDIIILFTTNAGAQSYNKKVIGLFSNEKNIIKEEKFNSIKNFFPIEFLNRLDDIIYFNNLSKENLENIIYKEINNIIQLSNNNINLKLSEEVYTYIVNKGYNINYGAREIKRIIEKELKLNLIKILKNDNIKNINNINIDYIKEKFKINYN